MRIMFFTDHFHPEPSAPAAHVYDRCRLWAAAGHQVVVVTSAPNFPLGRPYEGYRNALRTIETLDGVRVVRVKTYMAENKGSLRRVLDYCSYAISAFVQALREARPDVVVSTSPHLFVPIAGCCYARLKGIAHVFEVRDLWPASIAAVSDWHPEGRLYRYLEAIELALYRHSRHIIVLSGAFTEHLIARGVPGEKIVEVVNGVDLKQFRPQPRDVDLAQHWNLSGRFVVGYLGTIGGAHALAAAIEAAAILRECNVALLMVGVGAEKDDLERMARDRGLDNVVFTGRQRKEDMPSYWSLCDASLIHLKDDPLFTKVIPSKIFESMAMGVPIIYAVPRGEGARIVEANGAGLVTAPEDAEALAQTIVTLQADSALRTKLAERSLAAAPRYSRVRQSDDTLAVLQRAAYAERMATN